MNHVTAAASCKAVNELFNVVRDSFSFAASDSANWGLYGGYYSVAFHLEGGSVECYDDDSIQVKELDVKWDQLEFGVTLDIPGIEVGGWCIIPGFGFCLLRFPKISIFGKTPDIDVKLDLSDKVTSEISFRARPLVQHVAGSPGKWEVFLDPVTIDLDIFDVPDIVGDMLSDRLEEAFAEQIGSMIPDIPVVKQIAVKIIDGVAGMVSDILDLGDDIAEWVSDTLGVSLGLVDVISTAVADHILDGRPLHTIEDSFEAGPVRLPITLLTARVNSSELVLNGRIGAP